MKLKVKQGSKYIGSVSFLCSIYFISLKILTQMFMVRSDLLFPDVTNFNIHKYHNILLCQTHFVRFIVDSGCKSEMVILKFRVKPALKIYCQISLRFIFTCCSLALSCSYKLINALILAVPKMLTLIGRQDTVVILLHCLCPTCRLMPILRH